MSRGSAIGYWLAAWTLVVVALMAMSRTGPGRVIVYYSAWAASLFILLTQSTTISNIFQQANITAGE